MVLDPPRTTGTGACATVVEVVVEVVATVVLVPHRPGIMLVRLRPRTHAEHSFR